LIGWLPPDPPTACSTPMSTLAIVTVPVAEK